MSTIGKAGKLTKAQATALERLVADGFVEHKSSFGGSQGNRPYWRLVELGLAHFGFGPPDSFLKTQGYMPTDAALSRAKGEA